MSEFYQISANEAMALLKTTDKGLSSTEAGKRLEKFGPNELVEKRKKNDLGIFLDQFKSFLIIILLVAVVLSAALGETIDAIVISAIVILNASLGFLQVKKADEALQALKRMAAPTVKLLRDGNVLTLNSKEIVPGDILYLNVGDKVPADCRIIRQMNLKVDESILTGESTSVGKNEAVIKGKMPLHKHFNIAYSGTTIAYGRCEAVVISTGMKTEFGKIAETIQTPEEETPLQKKLDSFGKVLGILFIAVCFVIFGLGILRGIPFVRMFMISLSLAVAAVPEGLLAAITIALTLGVHRMAKRKAIVKRLTAVESLGSVDVICTDKTGTLTVNAMTVRKIWSLKHEINVTGEGYKISGDFLSENRKVDVKKFEDIKSILETGLLCNDAIVGTSVVGDPTEAALVVSAEKAGLKDIRSDYKRIVEIPFDSDRKIMSVMYGKNGAKIFAKGAVEEILGRCTHIRNGNEVRRIKDSDKKLVLEKNNSFAKGAFRVLAFAMKTAKAKERISEEGFVFLGLQAMYDPPRPEVKNAIELCKNAGIRIVMITGDHKDTAAAVAKELGLDSKIILTGEELDKLSDSEFNKIVEKVGIYARTSPKHKVRITKALRKKGHIVAMTGDGVNDAPALKNSDVGVAMGITGTDVTKEVGDIVIADDNFATIVSAISEGRGIYDNIRKCIAFLLSGNLGEIGIIFIAILAGLPVPLIAIQILWINLVTDGLPVIALSTDEIGSETMNKKPRKPGEKITAKMRAYIFDYPILMIVCAITLLIWSINTGHELIRSQTLVFTLVVIFEAFQAFSCRSLEKPVGMSAFRNKNLVYAITASICLHLLILYLQPLNELFHVVPLGFFELALIFGIGSLGFIYLEIYKLNQNRYPNTLISYFRKGLKT